MRWTGKRSTSPLLELCPISDSGGVENTVTGIHETLLFHAVLVHKSAVGRGSAAAIAVYQAMRCDTGMPSRVIRLSTEQATRASVFWRGRGRAGSPRRMLVLSRTRGFSPSERLP